MMMKTSALVHPAAIAGVCAVLLCPVGAYAGENSGQVRVATSTEPRVVDASVLLDWAEYRLPTLFKAQTSLLSRAAPSSVPLSVGGTDYTVRAYPNDRYLAVSTGGAVFGLGDFTAGVLASFGNTADLAALVLADARVQTVSVMLVSDVGDAEQFRFVLGAQVATATRKGEPVAFASALPSGSAYTVNQTDGPRNCAASSNRSGVVGFRDIVVTMDCGRPPGRSFLSGQLHAPVGSVVSLQVNGGAELSLTMPAFGGSNDPYNLLPFSFGSVFPDGTVYQVSILSAPPGQTCAVYKGSTGTLPVGLGALRVGCEWRDDLVSRSTNNNVRGSYFESTDLVLGGAAVAVGRTLDGYGEGRFAAFVSSAAGIGGATGSHRQLFWRDRLTGETVLVSASAAGVQGNGDSFAPAISADGLTVAFESFASNLVAGDANGVRDVFVWSANNRQLGAQRVSVGVNGLEGNNESFEPALSGDGRRVAFSTSASTLTPGVSGTSTVNVVLRDLGTGTNTLVSTDTAGQGVGGSRPVLSEDGSRLAFYSFSAQLVAGDTNGLWDIFVYEVATAALRRVSVTASGGERNQGLESASRVVSPSLSGDGRYVAFATTASNMVTTNTAGLQNVYVVDLQTGGVQHLSAGVGGVAGNGDSPVGQGERIALSYDGQWLAYTTAATNLGVQAGQVVLRNRVTGETRATGVVGGGSAYATLSRNAAYAGFGHDAVVDARFNGSGLFAEFTGLGRAWWWFD